MTRVMVWGAGFFGVKWLETLRARADYEVAAIVSRSPERREDVRRRLGLADTAAFATPAESVVRGRADAVIVALPQHLHREAILLALDAGLHVLSEKPLAVSVADARAIVADARRRGDRVVMVNQNFRWRPHTLALRGALRAARIGRPGHLAIECRQQIRRATIDGWREGMAEPYLLDFAIHHFDLVRYLTGEEAREVMGLSFRPPWSWFAGNAAALAVVTMESGLVVDYGGTMVGTGLETPQEGVITVAGERGTLQLDANSQVQLVVGQRRDALPAEPVPEGELGRALTLFADAIRSGRPPETGVEDNVRSLLLLLAVLESSRSRRPVAVSDLLGQLG